MEIKLNKVSEAIREWIHANHEEGNEVACATIFSIYNEEMGDEDPNQFTINYGPRELLLILLEDIKEEVTKSQKDFLHEDSSPDLLMDLPELKRMEDQNNN